MAFQEIHDLLGESGHVHQNSTGMGSPS
jgi:hypothetical protein